MEHRKANLQELGPYQKMGSAFISGTSLRSRPAGDNSVRLATTWQAPEGQSSDLNEAQATQAVQKFVWSSKVKSGWMGTRSLQVGGVGSRGKRESGGEELWFWWKPALETQSQVCRH